MNLNIFAIVIAALLVMQVIMIVLHVDFIPTVKAGNINDYHFRYHLNTLRTKILRIGNDIIDVSSLKKFRVCGNSMKDYNIHNGQTVFVESMDENNVNIIKNHPVLVFSLRETPGLAMWDSTLKLRKFVGYIDLSNDANRVYQTYSERIKIPMAEFEKEYETRKQTLMTIPDCRKKKYILSVTFNEKTEKYHYSIHSTDIVSGIAKYVL